MLISQKSSFFGKFITKCINQKERARLYHTNINDKKAISYKYSSSNKKAISYKYSSSNKKKLVVS